MFYYFIVSADVLTHSPQELLSHLPSKVRKQIFVTEEDGMNNWQDYDTIYIPKLRKSAIFMMVLGTHSKN